MCLGVGALGLFAVAKAAGQSLVVPRRGWKVLAVVAALNITGWHLLSALGMTGMAVLIGAELATVRAAPWGALSMIAAAVLWGAGTVAYKPHRWSTGTAALAGRAAAAGTV